MADCTAPKELKQTAQNRLRWKAMSIIVMPYDEKQRAANARLQINVKCNGEPGCKHRK